MSKNDVGAPDKPLFSNVSTLSGDVFLQGVYCSQDIERLSDASCAGICTMSFVSQLPVIGFDSIPSSWNSHTNEPVM
jgi:hypothetical protein